MITKKILITALSVFPFLIFCLLSGCMTAAQHHKELPQSNEKEMTVGVVQKEIKKGMSQADVAEALGSPNIVSKDSEEKEVWIYDKISNEVSYSKDNGGVIGGLLLVGGAYSKESGTTSSTQKTLTVVIKFDDSGKVTSFSYHASKF